MSTVDRGEGKFDIIPEGGDNPRQIDMVTITLDASYVGIYKPNDEAIPSKSPGKPPASSPNIKNGAPIHWFVNFKFTPLPQGNNPSFTLTLPYYPDSTYVYYNEVTQKLVPLDKNMTMEGSKVSFHLSMSDPSVGMT